MRLVRTVLIALAAATGFAFAVPALAANITMGVISTAPTNLRGEGTAARSALFELTQPAWPGRNECNLDGRGWQPCSFWFEANNLINGVHRLDVRQTDESGATKTDSWVWQVTSPVMKLEPHAVCRTSYQDEKTTYADRIWNKGRALYTWFNPTGAQLATPLNQPWPNNWGFETIYAAVWLPDPNDWLIVKSGGSNTSWSPGVNGPSEAGADVDIQSADLTRPGITVKQPGAARDTVRVAEARSWAGITPCLRIFPPPGLVDNRDGTLSATFGWTNLGPATVRTSPQGDFSAKAHLYGSSYVQGLSGGAETPSGMPTEFGANSSGTFTYTFPNPGADVPQNIEWVVGRSSAAFAIRPSLATGAPQPGVAGGGLSPFTHVDPQTPTVAPTRPVSSAANGSPAGTPPVGTAGGAVNTLTRLTVTTGVTTPRSRVVQRGQLIHFRSTIRNTGSVDAVNPELCDTIPQGMRFVSAPGRELRQGRRVCWTTSRMAAGTGVTGTMTLRATRTARIGTHTNVVTIKADNACATTARATFFVGRRPAGAKAQTAVGSRGDGNPLAAAATAVSATPQAATSLAFSAQVMAPRSRAVARGATITIRGTLRNTGALDADRPRICEQIPSGTTVVRAPYYTNVTRRTICWGNPSLAAGQSVTGTTVLRAQRGAKIGARASIVTASAANACPITSRTTFRVR